jgi:hypothetical protein
VCARFCVFFEAHVCKWAEMINPQPPSLSLLAEISLAWSLSPSLERWECLLTLNSLVVTFFSLVIHTLAGSLLLRPGGMGWTDAIWIDNYSRRLLFILIPSLSLSPRFRIPLLSFMCSAHDDEIYRLSASCLPSPSRMWWDLRMFRSFEWLEEVVKFQWP